MSDCNQSTITDRAFQYLQNVTSLNMSGCNQTNITSLAFRHLHKVTYLDMSGCDQTSITNSAFMYFTNVIYLDMSECNQSTITESAFVYLSQLTRLRMYGQCMPCVSNTALQSLGDITFHWSNIPKNMWRKYIGGLRRWNAYRKMRKKKEDKIQARRRVSLIAQ